MAVRHMMEKGWLDICTIDQVLKVTGGVPDKADYEALRLLHCVNFMNYPQAMRVNLLTTLQRVLSSPSMAVEIKFKAQARMLELAFGN